MTVTLKIKVIKMKTYIMTPVISLLKIRTSLASGTCKNMTNFKALSKSRSADIIILTQVALLQIFDVAMTKTT